VRIRAVALVVLMGLAFAGCALLSPRPAWELPPPPPPEGPVVDAAALHRERLANGLELLVLEDRKLPRVGIGLSVRSGAALERPEQAGLASYTAELMRRGAGERDALALDEAVDRLGATLAAEADWDATTVLVSGLSRDLDALFAVLADVVLRPRLETHEAERALRNRLASLERRKDDPATLASLHLSRAIYGEHRFGTPVLGTSETVATLDAAAARAWHERVFVPGNAILFASGDLDARDVLRRAREAFGAWPEAAVPEPGVPPPAAAPPERRVVVVDRPDLGQAQIRLGHEGISRADPERIASRLMNHALGGGGFGTRLMQSLRETSGLAYFAYSAFDTRRQPGPLFVATATRAEEAGRAVEIALAAMQAVREGGLSEEELARARSYTAGSFALGLETSADVIAALVELDLYGLPRDSLDTFRARVRAVQPEEVTRAARERLHPERAAIVAVGPAEVLRTQLERFGPVEISQP
jgi:zinc protease